MMHIWTIASSCITYAVLSVFILRSAGFGGMCNRQEVVSKTRNRKVYETYMENYIDHHYSYCYGTYRYDCTRQRQAGLYVTKEEIYTQLETKHFCCSGYREMGSAVCEGCTPNCEPVCELPCLYGTCTSPNSCDCNAGYSKRNGTENICEPVCSEPCGHGYCSKPETCTCDPGYRLDPSHRYTCDPVCSTPCVNANCTAPDVCTCLPGYNKVTDDPHKCHAHCSRPCQNGVCTKPETCSCLLGYKKDNYTLNICTPVCDTDCANGLCTGPNECTCFDGFTVVGKYYNCEPVCTSCLNAFCSAPNVCTCFDGYEVDTNDDSVCLPVCSPMCVNSNCSAPNTCECISGYEETDNTNVCKPYCSDTCVNGVCTEPDVCSCLWGFHEEGNTSNCSLSSSEKHSCTFINKFLGHDFNRSCFNISDEIPLAELTSCQLLQELLVKFNSVRFQFNCNEVIHLKRLGNDLSLELVCDVTINDGKSDLNTSSNEENYYTEEFGSSLRYTEEIEQFTEWPTFDGLYFGTELSGYSFSSSEPSISDSSSEKESASLSVSVLPVTSEANLGIDKTSQQLGRDFSKKEFQIIYKNTVESRMETGLTQDFPLTLNITLNFLSVTIEKHFTEDYFVDNSNNASTDQNWCICQKSKTWQLCAYADIQLVLCPCKYTSNGGRLTDNHSPLLSVKTVAVGTMALLLVVGVVVYLCYTVLLKQFGAYYTF